jgi:hypothetical protein
MALGTCPVLERVKRRRLIPGAETSEEDFRALFGEMQALATNDLQKVKRLAPAEDLDIIPDTARKSDFVRARHPHWGDSP